MTNKINLVTKIEAIELTVDCPHYDGKIKITIKDGKVAEVKHLSDNPVP
jgi:hypothetical protein